MFQPLDPTDYDQHIEIKFRDPTLWVIIKASFNQYQLARIQDLINTVGTNSFLTEEAIYAGIAYRRRVDIIHACLEELINQGWIMFTPERKIDPDVKHCFFECWHCGHDKKPTTFEADLSSKEVEEIEANKFQPKINLKCPRGHQMEYRNWRAWVPVDTAGYPILE